MNHNSDSGVKEAVDPGLNGPTAEDLRSLDLGPDIDERRPPGMSFS
jgi:hypothetical protein